MYPLRFEPAFRRYVWGGRRLANVLAKSIGQATAAESWEVVDHGDDQSIVRFGPLAGRNLHDLVVEFDEDLVGSRVWQQINDPGLPASLQLRFPLLFKFLDANRNLSVQVHPDDNMGSTLQPPDLGKTEAWYVLHADPGARVYAGLKAGVTADQFAVAVDDGTSESLLHSFEPKRGDCIFVEAGTMHAIGAGLLVAEIQQASNTTFRVFDWNRVDDQGRGRPLHIPQALAATNFKRGPVNPVAPVADSQPGWQTIVACDKFRMRRATIGESWSCCGDGHVRILAVIDGAVSIEKDPANDALRLGDTALLPACLPPIQVTSCGDRPAEILEITVG